jgi:hypothetical protein
MLDELLMMTKYASLKQIFAINLIGAILRIKTWFRNNLS